MRFDDNGQQRCSTARKIVLLKGYRNFWRTGFGESETERETERQRDRETETSRDIERQRGTEKQRNRETEWLSVRKTERQRDRETKGGGKKRDRTVMKSDSDISVTFELLC